MNRTPSNPPNAPLMVGVSGCRGILGSSLSPEVVARFAGAFAGWLTQSMPAGNRSRITVVLGRDGRAGCHVVHHAAMAGLLGGGVDVIDLGVSMTPTVAVAVDRARAAGTIAAGMVLTASHNPQEWNGLKCLLAENADAFGSGAAAPRAVLASDIAARFREGRTALAPWSGVGVAMRDDSATAAHIDRVAAAVEDVFGVDASEIGANRGVAIDSVNSSGVEGGLLMLERVGCSEILQIGGDTTGVFPHPPEPVREHLTSLAASVREIGASAGFAQDPDADRLAMIDETGHYIGEEYTFVLGALAALDGERHAGRKTEGRVLVTNLSTSRMIDDVAARYGAKVVRTPVGEAHVVEAMKREGALIGGEGNGGVIWPRVTYVRDSLSSMALTLGLITDDLPLSAIVKSLPRYTIVKRKTDLAKKDDADPALESIASHFREHAVDRQDGVRIDVASKRAWLHVRASNTEPIMRLIAEAPDEQTATAMLDEASQVIGRAS